MFNKSDDPQSSEKNKNLMFNSSEKRVHEFEAALNAPIVNMDILKQLVWDGAPSSNNESI